MCRWITLISSERYSLSDVVLSPSNSLVQQSRDASFHPEFSNAGNSPMNGDGFGVGWYHNNVAIYPDLNAVSHDGTSNTKQVTRRTSGLDEEGNQVASAAVFKDIYPAWNNMNLREICLSTSSDCIVAHVRAASKGTGVSHQNCHPFKAGRLLFCHNGRIFEFYRFRRRFRELLSDEAYNSVMGTTDSETVFALILTNLSKDGFGSPFEQTKPFGAKRLVAAMKKTMNQTLCMIQEFGAKEKGGNSNLNFALTDGDTMVVTRFCDLSPEVPPPSLYFAYGDAHILYKELTNEDPEPLPSGSHHDARDSLLHSDSSSTSADAHGFREQSVLLHDYVSHPGKLMVDIDPSKAAFIVSSDPLTKTHAWHPMPRNSIMFCTRGMHPELSLLKRGPDSTLMSFRDLKVSMTDLEI